MKEYFIVPKTHMEKLEKLKSRDLAPFSELLDNKVSASGFQGVCPETRSDKDSLWAASLSNSKQTIFHGELFAREIILVLTSFLNTFDEFPDAPLNLLVL